MAGPNDTFVRFVELLAASLDDHETGPTDLASRAFLSRCHFDRVVRSAAGEPPATFRRRILLERAAYRLITADLGILDVAVEAGYTSHEAFTRAFERAYGAPPSRWRAPGLASSRSPRRVACISIRRAVCGSPVKERWKPWTSWSAWWSITSG